MSANSEAGNAVEVTDDICALPLVRRLAAMLDRDPALLRNGDPLPRGWHVSMFNAPTRQSDLRRDGAASLGVTLPNVGLPRLMLGGRRIQFTGDIPIGAMLRRESRSGQIQIKDGRSGRFALVDVEHQIFVERSSTSAVVERLSYVLRAAATPAAAQSAPPLTVGNADTGTSAADVERVIIPDEALLFRYSAITDNPHRIHYDHPYATTGEGYPALVVNGSIPAMFLLEMFRKRTGREPSTFKSRNIAPMYCAQPLRLCLSVAEGGSKLWAQNEKGVTTFDASAE